MAVDIREIANCPCLALRRTTRHVTRIYDRLLEPLGLTVNQFGLLGYLHGASLSGRGPLSIGALAERIGMDPTTVNRHLKPLQALKLVAAATDPRDRRVRALVITRKGRAKLERAVPPWREARAQLEGAIGVETSAALKGLLDLSSARLVKRA
jgi:DNA-binding MarR family transcriptional regulator